MDKDLKHHSFTGTIMKSEKWRRVSIFEVEVIQSNKKEDKAFQQVKKQNCNEIWRVSVTIEMLHPSVSFLMEQDQQGFWPIGCAGKWLGVNTLALPADRSVAGTCNRFPLGKKIFNKILWSYSDKGDEQLCKKSTMRAPHQRSLRYTTKMSTIHEINEL